MLGEKVVLPILTSAPHAPQVLLQRLEEQVAAVLADPDRPLDKLFADMRQTSYKVKRDALLGHSLLAETVGVAMRPASRPGVLTGASARCKGCGVFLTPQALRRSYPQPRRRKDLIAKMPYTACVRAGQVPPKEEHTRR